MRSWMVTTRRKGPQAGPVFRRLCTRSTPARFASRGRNCCLPSTQAERRRARTGTVTLSTRSRQGRLRASETSRLTNAVMRTSGRSDKSVGINSRAYVSGPLDSPGTRKTRFRPTCMSSLYRTTDSSPDSPPKSKTLDESDLRIERTRGDVSARQTAGSPPAADSRPDRDSVPRERHVRDGHKGLRGEGSNGGTTSQDTPAPKKK